MADFGPVMNRSVMQLLFTYLPGRTVDWENGAAIVVLDSPRLENIWPARDARLVLEEVSRYLARWRARGGRTDLFPEPDVRGATFIVGTPLSINAKVLMTALRCYECSQLVFHRRQYMAFGRNGINRTRCPNCKRRTLRQFGLVFVHGCGRIEPLTQEISRVGRDGTPKKRPVRCEKCRSTDHLMLKGKSDRASGLTVVCRQCQTEVIDRFVASCPDCARTFVRASAGGAFDASALRKQTLMRITRHSASEAYYAHTTTVLRLGRVPTIGEPDAEMQLLQRMLPADLRAQVQQDVTESLEDLLARVQRAQQTGDVELQRTLMARIAELAARSARGEVEGPARASQEPGLLVGAAPDVQQAVMESQALLETVLTTPAVTIAERAGGASGGNSEEAKRLMERLGLRRLEVVDDLPIVSAAFGYTRRSFEPTYEELGDTIQLGQVNAAQPGDPPSRLRTP